MNVQRSRAGVVLAVALAFSLGDTADTRPNLYLFRGICFTKRWSFEDENREGLYWHVLFPVIPIEVIDLMNYHHLEFENPNDF
jgi:hypothetical protein